MLQPVFGLFASFSENTGYRGGLNTKGDLSNTGLELEDLPRITQSGSEVITPETFHVGINLGLNYRMYLNSRFPIEFMVLGYLSPSGLFETQIRQPNTTAPDVLRGRYHHLTVGINIPFKVFPPKE